MPPESNPADVQVWTNEVPLEVGMYYVENVGLISVGRSGGVLNWHLTQGSGSLHYSFPPDFRYSLRIPSARELAALQQRTLTSAEVEQVRWALEWAKELRSLGAELENGTDWRGDAERQKQIERIESAITTALALPLFTAAEKKS